jgi:hypothetical protein
MVTNKLNAADDKSIAAKAKRSRRKREPQAAQESQVEGRKPLYVQITPAAKNILEGIAEQGVTKARVIEALLEYFTDQDKKTKEEILEGKSINPRKEYDDLLGLLNWAQHAFDNKRYILAVKLYTNIKNRFKSSEGFMDFCNYKLGTCWIRLSYELRKEALKDPRNDESYPLAQQALDTAIGYTKEVKGHLSGPLSILIRHYNLACCHSLKAQYLVEARLDPQDEFTMQLRDTWQDVAATVKVWEESIGGHWREKDKGRNADAEAEQALKELQEMYSVTSPEQPTNNSDKVKEDDMLLEIIWLTEAGLEDEDLIFLRFDKQKWQPEFTKWSNSVLQQGDKSIADTIRVLLPLK